MGGPSESPSWVVSSLCFTFTREKGALLEESRERETNLCALLWGHFKGLLPFFLLLSLNNCFRQRSVSPPLPWSILFFLRSAFARKSSLTEVRNDFPALSPVRVVE